MKKRFSTAILQPLMLFGLLCLTVLPACSQTATPFSINESSLGAPTSPVMDYVGVLDANTKQALERKIIAFRDSTNPKVELAVAIVATTDGREIFDYSLAVSRGWKIGSKEQDNPSALLVVAVNDRKYYTQVSRDLEDELPDGLVGQLQRQNLVPAFRQQNYGKGVSDTIDAYIATIQSKQTGTAPPVATTEQQPKQKKSSMSVCSIGICALVLIFIILPLLSRRSRGGRDDDDDRRGGGFGGGAASALPWVIGSILANSGSSSSSSDWGGSSGGDSGWGGFGGGGDFGGGGAGGDW